MMTQQRSSLFAVACERFGLLSEEQSRFDSSLASTEVSSVVKENLQYLGTKVLKAAASDFAYISYSRADTQKLTSLVAACVSKESLEPFLKKELKLNSAEELHFFLGCLCIQFPQKIHSICQFLVPFFVSVERECSSSLELPSLITQLLPSRNLQGLSTADRLQLLRDELGKRGDSCAAPVYR
jgi:hypothetical protein